MKIDYKCILPYHNALSEPESVFKIVEEHGTVVLLKDNQPAYLIIKADSTSENFMESLSKQSNSLTLHEAMKIVLSEKSDNTLHASDLADEIFERKLYLQKNGSKAHYTQIRARCTRYPEMFEALPGNYVKLKSEK